MQGTRTLIRVSGGAVILTLLARTTLARQAAVARRRIGKPLGEDALDADRVWGARRRGAPLHLVLLGDSIAAGLGASRPKETLGGRLAKGISRALDRPVHLHTLAQVGSESSALAGQVARLPRGLRPDAAVIVVGGNDVTHRRPVMRSAAHLAEAVRALRERGIPVIVGTCPDLVALRPVPQPLRTLAGRLSRRLAFAQAREAARAGGVVVSLRATVGPVFLSRPEEMFAMDRFHPSAAGYRRTAEAFIPAIIQALHAVRVDGDRPGPVG
ncbi:SGNH/GDSL hydrolase family protein [Microbacterium aurantiacum]|uniref:SGNH/GDSL hydrolase family protein n=1 Tax=Microbacterium aurantiacum TaxID=162393 RepID=UPI001F2A62A0|nr:SGNH/GDSL hydrolase family protein [Microbacterium aurantiacum]